MLGEKISTAGPIQIYSRVLLKFHAFYGTRVHHGVIALKEGFPLIRLIRQKYIG